MHWWVGKAPLTPGRTHACPCPVLLTGTCATCVTRIWLSSRWTGRGLVLLAGVNICLGISLWRRVSGGSGSEWVVTLILFAVLWLGLAAWLEWRAPPGLGRETAPPPVDNGIAAGLTAGFASSSNPSTAGNEVNMTRLAAGSFAPTVGYSKLAEPAPAPSHAHRS